MDPTTLTALAIGTIVLKWGTAALGIATIGLFFSEVFRHGAKEAKKAAAAAEKEKEEKEWRSFTKELEDAKRIGCPCKYK